MWIFTEQCKFDGHQSAQAAAGAGDQHNLNPTQTHTSATSTEEGRKRDGETAGDYFVTIAFLLLSELVDGVRSRDGGGRASQFGVSSHPAFHFVFRLRNQFSHLSSDQTASNNQRGSSSRTDQLQVQSAGLSQAPLHSR